MPDTKQRVVSFDRLPGGQVATAIAVCAKLGCRARYAGVFGDDVDGRWVRAHLESLGIDVAAVSVAGAPSRTASIIVAAADGARTVLEHRDSRLSDGFSEPVAGRVCQRAGADDRRHRRRCGGRRPRRWPATPACASSSTSTSRTTTLAPLLARTDILITSATVPQELTGAASVEEGLRRLAGRTPAALLVATLGADGSVALLGGRVIRTPAVRVEVVDTTGAGDAFRGGFVAGWLRQDAAPDVELLLRQANAAAGLSCRARGAQGALPTWREIDEVV